MGKVLLSKQKIYNETATHSEIAKTVCTIVS